MITLIVIHSFWLLFRWFILWVSKLWLGWSWIWPCGIKEPRSLGWGVGTWWWPPVGWWATSGVTGSSFGGESPVWIISRTFMGWSISDWEGKKVLEYWLGDWPSAWVIWFWARRESVRSFEVRLRSSSHCRAKLLRLKYDATSYTSSTVFSLKYLT